MKNKALLPTVLVLASLTFGYNPTPYPVTQPGDPFLFDPNDCPSPPMGAFIIPVGSTYNGILEVTEPDGEDIVLTASLITIQTPPNTVKDPNDPLGLAVKHTYNWSFTPTADDIGLHHVNVNVSDPLGATDDRTLVLLIKVNQAPVITGCQ